jgi:parvulin-like peptidyl-prolyl isomerase
MRGRAFFRAARAAACVFIRLLAVMALAGAICARPLSARAISAQEVIDRVAARIENDIILLSDVQQLGRYQKLVDGKSEDQAKLLDRLIDQWVVQNEADASRFPHPSDAEIEQSLATLKKSFASPQEYQERKKQSGLSDAEVRDKIATQLYLTNYLESRFRPSVQVDAKAIEDFYKTAVLPRAKARGQEPPSLEASRDVIQDALVQQSIDSQADQWLKESRARIHVERLLQEGPK